MNRAKYLSFLAGLTLLTAPSLSQAQIWDNELLAYESSSPNAQYEKSITADDEIFAAMQALEEVEAVMSDKGVDLDALLMAAEADLSVAAKNNQERLNQPAATAPPSFVTTNNAAPMPEPKSAAPTVAIDELLAAANEKRSEVSTERRSEVQANSMHEQIKAKETAPVLQASLPQVPMQKFAAVTQQTNPVTATTKQASAQLAQPNPKAVAKVSTALPIAVAPKGKSNTPRPLALNKAANSLAMAYVAAIYKANGIDLSKASTQNGLPSIAELYQFAFKQKAVYNKTRPAIGDLAFFHNTYDRNRDGRWNDWHSLIGIVESIDKDDTITVLTYDDQQIQRIQLNLKYPEIQTGRKKQTLNTQLRPDEGAQKGTAAKLFGGFANLLGDAVSITVIDNWKPGL